MVAGPHEPPSPTVDALLALPELGLELIGGSRDTGFSAVRWTQNAADHPWLGSSDLRLNDAPFVLPRPPNDPLLAPPPAIVVHGLTPQGRELPEGLASRAAELEVTLLTSPPSVALERVEEAALRLLVGAAPRGLAALASPQSYLLAALAGSKPERDLLERIHLLTGSDLLLLTPWGEVMARAGRSGWRPRHDAEGVAQIMGWPEGQTRLAGRDALTLRLTAGGRLRGVLIAFEATQAAMPWLELARTLLLSAALQRSAEARRDSSSRSALLAEWLAGPQAAPLLGTRLAAAGIGEEAQYLVAAAEVGPRLPSGKAAEAREYQQLERIREAGEEYFGSLGYGVLSETRSHHCLWVFATGAPQAHAQPLFNTARSAAGGDDVRLGLSLPRSDLTGVADAYHQATLALQSLPASSGLAWFDELDPLYWVMQQQPPGNLVTLRDRLVGAVKTADADGKLWRTLQAYLRSPDDLQSLADELHVHVNTLRYRLKRIEELVQEPLKRPETLAKVYLALQIDAMLERAGHPER